VGITKETKTKTRYNTDMTYIPVTERAAQRKNLRYCLGECRTKTPHTKLLKTDGMYEVTCHYCNRKADAVA